MPIDEFKIRGLYDSYAIRERLQFMIYARNRMTNLSERAFPSCPRRPPQYELRITRDDGKLFIFATCEVFPMRKFLDIIEEDDSINWITDTKARIRDITIQSKHLKRFVTYKYEGDEASWILPLPYNYNARQIGFHETYSEAQRSIGNSTYDDAQKSKSRNSDATSSAKAATRSAKRRNNDKSQYNLTLKNANSATFGIPEISAHTGIDPSKVRALLRKAITKPQEGWEWPKSSFEEIISKIKK
jgi:hypothetical protein